MNRFILLCALAAPYFVNFALAQDIDGKWTGQMEGRDGQFDIVCSFKTNGDTLTGSVALPRGEIPISNGRVNGSKFSFDVIFGERTISHQCTLLADSVSMKYVGAEGYTRQIILKRREEAKKKERAQ